MSLKERFAAGSRFDSDGEFTLDESKAKEKMARFQLSSPTEFLMLVVQAAVASKCCEITVHQAQSELRVVAKGADLDPEAVKDKESFLFESDGETLPYHLLGVAANAVEPQCSQAPVVAMVDGDLHFEVQLNSALVGLRGLLLVRLPYLPCPLTLDGESLSTSDVSSDIDLALHDSESEIALVKFGVIVHRERRKFRVNCRAVVRADDLSVDASYSQVVKDRRYDQLIAGLEKQANQLLADRVKEQPDSEPSGTWLTLMRELLPDPAGTALESAPLFPLADRAGEMSFREIMELVSRQGSVFVSRRRFNVQLETPCVLLFDPPVEDTIRKLLPSKSLQDAESQIQKQQLVEARRKAWESSPRPLELPPGETICRAIVEGRGWKAAIGVWRGQLGANRAEILYQGRLLSTAPLNNVPPGSTAVVDVTEGEVAPSWLGLEEKRLRTVLQGVQSEIAQLWRSQSHFEVSDLSPQGLESLLNDLYGTSPSEAAKNTPLFPTLDGKTLLSFRELEAMDEVRLGEPTELSPRTAQALGSAPILLYSPERLRALYSKLGRERVRDLRGRQEALARLDWAWANPSLPTVTDRDYLSKATFKHQDSHGEIALFAKAGGGTDVTLRFEGAIVETVRCEGARLLSFQAAVEAPQLTLAEDLTAFVEDDAYTALLSALAESVQELERRAFFHPDLAVMHRFKLATLYDYSERELEETPLVPSPDQSETWTLRSLREELQTHGCLLTGKMGVEFPGRRVVLNERQVLDSVKNLLGEVTWSSAEALLSQMRKSEQFQALPVARKIAVRGRYPLRTEVSEGRGEVVLAAVDASDAGMLYAYVDGRFVCTKERVLPSDFVAALEHPDFALSEDFQDVGIPDSVRALLQNACDQTMLEAAGSNLKLRSRAWKYFASNSPSEQAKQAFLDGLQLELLDGRVVTFAQLLQLKVQGYVRPEFHYDGPRQGAVIRALASDIEYLGSLLGKRLAFQESFLQREMERQRALEHLPRSVASDLFSRDFEGGGGRGKLALSREGKLVGLNSEGEVMGVLRELRLPVIGLVWGAERSGQSKVGEEPQATLPRPLQLQVEQWSESLCLEWVKGLGDHPLSSGERALALALLRVLIREVSSKDDRASSTAATLLWDLPLFARVDRTLVSGSALAATLAESGQQLTVASSRFRSPGDALFLAQQGEERAILTSFFGKAGLREFEAPPLLDVEELARTAKSVVSWGVAPAVAGWKAWNKTMDYLSTLGRKEEGEKVRDPREVLLVQLREDIRSLVGRKQYQESDGLFQNLDFGRWPLGPPIYKPRKLNQYRLNSLHPAVRWLLSREASASDRRAVRMLLVVHWVGLVNERSESLSDSHEDAFLDLLVERMAQTFSAQAEVEAEPKPSESDETATPLQSTQRKRVRSRKSKGFSSPFESKK